ncbi:AMP-binding protein [Streptomyces meridianus]|uniref:AMP-binding protein n=1 Tax=Streptomyces meridianus TaxID=2938945 RepID=A0ABT0X3P4_9ACTN|nr:AMP-binding protein [Streptomyces meridianus]MCM2576543.1 AMP-binding protein [Streptomyces meridianus]
MAALLETLEAPSPERLAEYRAEGWWRESTFLDDLARASRERPGHPAVIGYLDGAHERTLTYAELAATVDRFAGAFTELGVGRGDVVALYLPNRWMFTPLLLACHRVGAVVATVGPPLADWELNLVLEATSAKLCVTVDTFEGIDYAARLAAATSAALEHRVVVGNASATGAMSFGEFFLDTPWEERHTIDPSAALGPTEPALLLSSSGTTGPMKTIAHSQDTVYSSVRAVSVPHGITADDVIAIPHYATHMAALSYSNYMALLVGGTCVMQDTNTDMNLLLDLVARHGVSWLYAAPGYLVNACAAQQEKPRETGTLRHIVSGSAPIQPQLIDDVRGAFGVEPHALWGMTENGAVTITRPDDPPGWAAHSDGSPVPWMEIRIAEDPEADPDAPDGVGRLLVRGASQCLGYAGQRETYEASVDADGWFDTGDLAKDDGRGGIRITGRRVDLIIRSNAIKIPTLAIEAVLLRHPKITEVVLVGYPDPAVPGTELACAVVVFEGEPPTLEELHEHLEKEGVARVMWPDRVQFVWQLPKNSLGKVIRQPLRERLETAPVPRA